MNPFWHPFKWSKAQRAHLTICHAHWYLCNQPQPHDKDAIWLLYEKSWELYNELTDYIRTR